MTSAILILQPDAPKKLTRKLSHSVRLRGIAKVLRATGRMGYEDAAYLDSLADALEKPAA